MIKETTAFFKHYGPFLIFIFLIFIFTITAHAQMSNYISSLKNGSAKDKSPLTVTAELISPENISSINIAFRSFGQNEYKKEEMRIAGTEALVIIPGEDIVPPYIEYYIIIDLKNGGSETYPIDVEKGGNPVQVTVSGISEKDREILVLSPSDNEVFTKQDFLITISFLKAPSNIAISKTKIYLNDKDITSSELLTDDLILISGENLPEVTAGSKSLRIEVYDDKGNLYHTIDKNFVIASRLTAEEVASVWNYNGSLRGESRNENYNSSETWYNNLSAEINASKDAWRFNGYAYVTSEEKSNKQPYDRYSATIQNGNWLDVKFGDSYPKFPQLIMEGKRIRGINGSLNFGFFNLHAVFGQTVRKVEGQLLQTYAKGEDTLASNVIPIDPSKYNGAAYGRVNLGTYNRELFAIRPSFGSGENFQFGLSYLHSKDDPNSIEFGTQPQENALFGSDLMFALDNHNIIFTSQAAVSMLNKDISSGNMTDAQIDSLFGPSKYFNIDPGTIKSLRDFVDNFITFNQYIGPLNPQKFASLVGETALSLNYFNNSFKASYIYRGNDYQSFGQTFIRTDVKGINLIDRIRMIDNKLFVSLGYEDLHDNLQNTKPAVTKYQTLSASVSVFPRMDFPNITFGYNRYNNNNGIDISDTVINKYAINDLTNRYFVSMSYDFHTRIRHSTSLSFSTSKRDDNSLLNSDATFTSGTIGINSFWTRKLNSIFQIVYSSSEIATIPFEYFTLVAGGRYSLLEDRLMLSFTFSPSFGDFKRQAVELVTNYNLLANLNLVFQARIFRIPGRSTNSIIGLSTSYIF